MGITIKKLICLLSVTIAVAVTVFYMRLGGLFTNASALSKTGLEHPIFFSIWGVCTYFALAFNIHTAYAKTKYKFYFPLLVVSLIGLCLTLLCNFDYSVYPQYIAHCIGSLTFSAVTGVCVFLLFLLTKKYTLMSVCGVVLFVDLIFLIIFKETALIEVVPIFVGYVLLLINNLTVGKKERDKIEA